MAIDLLERLEATGNIEDEAFNYLCVGVIDEGVALQQHEFHGSQFGLHLDGLPPDLVARVGVFLAVASLTSRAIS